MLRACDATMLYGGSWNCSAEDAIRIHIDCCAAVSVLYRLDPAKVRNIYITFGRDYREVGSALAHGVRSSLEPAVSAAHIGTRFSI